MALCRVSHDRYLAVMTDTRWTSAPAGAALPPGITRSRAELQQLRDDALAADSRDPVMVPIAWCSPQGLASALDGITDTTRWLLGEKDRAPISLEPAVYPALPIRGVRTHAEDALHTSKWPDVSEWYAGAVKLTVEWAMGGHERPMDA
jgi:hypothetical protein